MVPRDRIELSTPAFSGLMRNKYFQGLVRFRKGKQRQRASCKINGLQGTWAVGGKDYISVSRESLLAEGRIGLAMAIKTLWTAASAH